MINKPEIIIVISAGIASIRMCEITIPIAINIYEPAISLSAQFRNIRNPIPDPAINKLDAKKILLTTTVSEEACTKILARSVNTPILKNSTPRNRSFFCASVISPNV